MTHPIATEASRWAFECVRAARGRGNTSGTNNGLAAIACAILDLAAAIRETQAGQTEGKRTIRLLQIPKKGAR